MIGTIQQAIQDDAQTLITRALRGKTVNYFGIDGMGKHGKNDLAGFSTIWDAVVSIRTFSDDMAEMDANLLVFLNGYSAKTSGHIVTDCNFMISIREHLKADHIDPLCIRYADLAEQADDMVALKLDVPKLLAW